MPVIALPRIRPSEVSVDQHLEYTIRTMNIALPFVSLSDEEVGNVPAYAVFVTDRIAPENLL